jgi:UDP-2-acetamido-3-amino-2,3-dideoxy-glucuronate N-acetyltransferase
MSFIHPSAIIDPGAIIGEGTFIWHFCHVSGSSVIGKDCVLGQNVYVGPNVEIGNNVKVQNNVSLFEGVRCEDDVFLGPSVVFTNIKTPRSRIDRKKKFIATLVRKGATIGANATIICGNEIGAYSFIGAGAVVTRSVLPYAQVMGNPAKQTGWVSEAGHTLSFSDDRIAICKETGEVYVLEGKTVRKQSAVLR